MSDIKKYADKYPNKETMERLANHLEPLKQCDKFFITIRGFNGNKQVIDVRDGFNINRLETIGVVMECLDGIKQDMLRDHVGKPEVKDMINNVLGRLSLGDGF